MRKSADQTAVRNLSNGEIGLIVQMGLAVAALVCGMVAVMGGALGLNGHDLAQTSFCLGAPQNSALLTNAGHCPWCYSALGLMALALVPIKSMRASLIGS